MRKTKIICTLGPSTDDEQILEQMMLSGMNVARFNFSHQDHETHKKRLQLVFNMRKKLGLPIAALLDTRGPEIRLGKFDGGKAELKNESRFVLTTKDVLGNSEIASVSYKGLPGDVKIGAPVLIDDGLIELSVLDVTETDILCKVINGGMLSNNKGVNLPGAHISMPFISEIDRSDIVFGIEEGFDFIAASFTRSAEDILSIRRILDEYSCNTINIVAKIENAEGVANIDQILRVADGIMIARGDMGVEIPLEEVPILQKMLIKKAYSAGKQVITATQMLESMMKNPRPTRAEASDIANAIYDGTSAIMLSGETAAGLYPVEAVKTMAKIAVRAENDIDYEKRLKNRDVNEPPSVTNAISHATCTTAIDLAASAIITVTKSGKTARMTSKFRPACPIIACTTEPHVCRQLNMSWGVTPILIDEKNDTDELLEHAVEAAEGHKLVRSGDLVVITAGIPLGISGTTNMMKVHVVGKVLVSGHGITAKSLCGNLCVCESEPEAVEKFKPGDILVIPQTSNEIFPILKKAGGIVTEQGGTNSHAAVAGLALDIPVVVGAENATKILKSGTTVTLDAQRGIVSIAKK